MARSFWQQLGSDVQRGILGRGVDVALCDEQDTNILWLPCPSVLFDSNRNLGTLSDETSGMNCLCAEGGGSFDAVKRGRHHHLGLNDAFDVMDHAFEGSRCVNVLELSSLMHGCPPWSHSRKRRPDAESRRSYSCSIFDGSRNRRKAWLDLLRRYRRLVDGSPQFTTLRISGLPLLRRLCS